LLYPNLGLLFIVSPIACVGVLFFLQRIKSDDIDHEAARGLERTDQQKTGNQYLPPSEAAGGDNKVKYNTEPSFKFGFDSASVSEGGDPGVVKPSSPLQYVFFLRRVVPERALVLAQSNCFPEQFFRHFLESCGIHSC
jgi:hypothetical protein